MCGVDFAWREFFEVNDRLEREGGGEIRGENGSVEESFV